MISKNQDIQFSTNSKILSNKPTQCASFFIRMGKKWYYTNRECDCMPNLYKRLRNLREDHDLTQKDVAEHLKCSRTAYEGYERGYRNIPVEHLMKLSELYSVSMEYIVEMTNDKKGIK